jgi:hypothetical protein
MFCLPCFAYGVLAYLVMPLVSWIWTANHWSLWEKEYRNAISFTAARRNFDLTVEPIVNCILRQCNRLSKFKLHYRLGK